MLPAMCTNYIPSSRDHIASLPGLGPVALPAADDTWPAETYPGYAAPIVVGTGQGGPAAQCVVARFGLVPRWCADARQASTVSRGTYNARSETVASKPSFRDVWKNAQHCIIPAESFYEPDWRSGRPVPTRIARADGEPMGMAGLWSAWKSPKGDVVHSFTLLTINAAQHPLMRLFHKPVDEKRMVVILQEDRYDDWLNAGPAESKSLLRAYPAENLAASAALGPQAALF